MESSLNYEQKYLKYKSKYLSLKSSSNQQKGGAKNSIYGNNIMELEELGKTPTITESYQNEKINFSKKSDIKKLSKLLQDSEHNRKQYGGDAELTSLSESLTSLSVSPIHQESNHPNLEAKQELTSLSESEAKKELTSLSESQPHGSEKSESHTEVITLSDSSETSTQQSIQESTQQSDNVFITASHVSELNNQLGGKKKSKKNKNKKHFFDDSDLSLSSTTDSILSSISSSDSDL